MIVFILDLELIIQIQNVFIKKNNVHFKLGTQIPIDQNYVIHLYECPTLINLNSGRIKQRFEDINSAKQFCYVNKSPSDPFFFTPRY